MLVLWLEQEGKREMLSYNLEEYARDSIKEKYNMIQYNIKDEKRR